MSKKVIAIPPEQRRAVEAAVADLATPVLGDRLLEAALELEANQWFLRLYVEGRGFKVSLDDCANISRALDPLLEPLESKLPPYTLEVSSPGRVPACSKPSGSLNFYQGREIQVAISAEDAPTGKRPRAAAKPKPLIGTLTGFDPERRVAFLQPRPGKAKAAGKAAAEPLPSDIAAIEISLDTSGVEITLHPDSETPAGGGPAGCCSWRRVCTAFIATPLGGTRTL